MRTSFIGFLCLLNVSYAFDFPIFYSHPYWNDFKSFMKTHNKHYPTSELIMRYKTFIDNMEFMLSNTNKSHSFSVNKYADMNQSEFENKKRMIRVTSLNSAVDQGCTTTCRRKIKVNL